MCHTYPLDTLNFKTVINRPLAFKADCVPIPTPTGPPKCLSSRSSEMGEAWPWKYRLPEVEHEVHLSNLGARHGARNTADAQQMV